MAKEYAKDFYNSVRWRFVAQGYRKSQNELCERCGSFAVIVHHKNHITPENIHDVNITLNWENLEALCMDCHNKEHASSEGCDSELTFNEQGQLVKR